MFQAFASHMTTETQKQLELHRMQQEQLKRQQEHIMHQQHKIQELQVSGSWSLESVLCFNLKICQRCERARL